MMASKLIKRGVMSIALLLMATYMILNYHKLTVLAAYWKEFKMGSTAPVASVKLAEETVFQQPLNTSDVFDSSGNRQINILPVPQEIFETIGGKLEATRLVIDQQDLPVSSVADKSALFAIAKDRKIYLVAKDTLKPMMTVIWNEQLRLKSIIRCLTPDLCNSLLISSRNWGPVEGPYSDSDFSTHRRGMPRGRWARLPNTFLNIQSKRQQKVWLQINLLAVHPDQKVSFRGAASKAQKLAIQSTALAAGGRSLTPAAYLVLLELRPGNNGLEINYSLGEKPASEDASSLAAYITAIGVDKGD